MDEIDAQLRETEQQRNERQQAVNELRELADNVRLAVREVAGARRDRRRAVRRDGLRARGR